MKKTDIAILLSPSIMFFLIVINCLWIAQILQNRISQRSSGQQKWEKFLANLDSGKSELKYDKATEDKMLEAMRLTNRVAVSERSINDAILNNFEGCAEVAILGIVLQLVALLSMQDRIRKRPRENQQNQHLSVIIEQLIKLICRAFLFGGVCYLVWFGLSWLALKLFPYRGSEDDFAHVIYSADHVVGEKIAGWLFLSITSFCAARFYRPTWRIGVLTGFTAAIVFQLIAISVFIARYGFSAYQENHRFVSSIFWTVILGLLFGFIAVRDQHETEDHTTQPHDQP